MELAHWSPQEVLHFLEINSVPHIILAALLYVITSRVPLMFKLHPPQGVMLKKVIVYLCAALTDEHNITLSSVSVQKKWNSVLIG